MSRFYDYTPHPRAEELRASGPTKSVDVRRIHSDNPVVRFNARFGLKVTTVVGTMWCAYLFATIALISLPSTLKTGNLFEIVVWISSSFLQLVLLPIIIVGQNIQAKANDKRAEDTYKDAEAVLREAEEIQHHLEAQDERINEILERLAAIAKSA